MALASRQYRTDDLTYWTQLRYLDPYFLRQIDRFYLFFHGRCLLYITHDDRVYFCRCGHRRNLEDLDQWSTPREIKGFSGRRVMMVIFKRSRMYALTEDGLVLYMVYQEWWTRPVVLHTRAAQLAVDYELFVLTLDGELLMINVETGLFPVVQLVKYGQVLAIKCFRNQVAALTITGQCLIIIPLYGDSLDSPESFDVLQVPPLPATPVAIHFELSLTILARDGKIYTFSDPTYPTRPGGRICSKPYVTSLDKPIRYLYDCSTFEDISGQLYSYTRSCSVLSIPSTFTSYADLHIINDLYRSSPGLTAIPKHAFQSAGLFNNPLECDFRITDLVHLDGEIHPKTVCFVSRNVLWNELPSVREEMHESSKWMTIEHHMSEATLTLFRYLRYLHTGSVDSFEQCSFTMYLQAQILLDKTTEDLLVGVLSRQLSRLYQTSPFRFRVFLESNLFYNIYNYNELGILISSSRLGVYLS